MDDWEFDCPQFVDFAAALDSPSNEVFYDLPTDGETTVSESDFEPKMATPKVRLNEPLKSVPFVNFSDDAKVQTLYKLPARLSKSDGCINQIIDTLRTPDCKYQPQVFKSKRRSSFPMNCIKKKRVCAITPNCLKRTLGNSKLRNVKTSEELELQKIAELQSLLHKHLRLNKINFKRMKMNKAPFTLEKLPKKSESKDTKSTIATSSKYAASTNRPLYQRGNAACSSSAKVNGNPLGALQDKQKQEVVPKKKAPPNVLRDHNVQKEDSNKALNKLPLLEKYNAHGGLRFLPHQESTTPRPFSFDANCATLKNSSTRADNLSKLHSSLSVSRNTPHILENKENLVK